MVQATVLKNCSSGKSFLTDERGDAISMYKDVEVPPRVDKKRRNLA